MAADDAVTQVRVAPVNQDYTVEYTCAGCDVDSKIRRGDVIRCSSCGHRVFYKKRTNRMVQFEAR